MTPDQATVITSYVLTNIEQEAKTTGRVLAAVPQNKCDYKPDEKSKTAFDLARHIAIADVWFLESVANGGFEYARLQAAEQEIKTVADAVRYYEERIPKSIERVRALNPEQTAQILAFGPFQLPAVMFVTLGLKHGIHHRGQLSAYLRAMGSTVPAIYGGSADEPMRSRASN